MLRKKEAIVAVAHSIIIAIWHVLDGDCDDVGSDWYHAWDPIRTRSGVPQS